MTDREIRMTLLDKLDTITKIIQHGNDVEIRKDGSGVKVLEVKKAVVR